MCDKYLADISHACIAVYVIERIFPRQAGIQLDRRAILFHAEKAGFARFVQAPKNSLPERRQVCRLRAPNEGVACLKIRPRGEV
jgi:hypothetical protein